MTPRQLHAILHHAQIRRKKELADLAFVSFAGAQCDKKGIEAFTKDLTRDA